MSRRSTLLRRLLSPFVRRSGLARDERGATAVEFGLLALPFFTLIYAILETSIVFFAGQILDSALHDASRKIRTGQAQTENDDTAAWTPERFRQEVCDGLYGMFDCSVGAQSRLWVSVSLVDTFSAAAITSPIADECLLPPAEEAEEEEAEGDPCDWAAPEAYTPGLGSQIVVVQAFYKWPTLVNLPGFNLATQIGGDRLLSAARVFRNEPF